MAYSILWLNVYGINTYIKTFKSVEKEKFMNALTVCVLAQVNKSRKIIVEYPTIQYGVSPA